MAQYTVTYACGHTELVSLFGKESERQSRIKYLETCDCAACQMAARMEILYDDVEKGMSNLKGSDKQRAWAAEIRHNALRNLDKWLDENEEDLVDGAADAIRKKAKEIDKSSWWIDNKGRGAEALAEKIFALTPMARGEEASNPAPETGTIAASAAAVVHPDDETHSGTVVDIKILDKTVILTAPKNETLRQIVKSQGYQWKGGAWRLEESIFTGAALDRAAELGNACLLAGFPVRMWDEELRRKAINADFQPRQYRWVSLRAGGTYDGWLALNFERNDELYQTCRKIRGSKWDSPSVMVKVEQYRQVEDLAYLWDFQFTPGAERAIEAYKSAETAPVAVKKPEKSENASPDGKLRGILESSRDVLEDLVDDD